MHVLCANPRFEHCHTASYVSVPLRLTMPTDLPVVHFFSDLCVWMYPGMMPILQPPLV